jgi:hypothetical protein
MSATEGPRLDHVVIATTRLDAISAAHRRLGFVVEDGGRHPGRGTRNSLIRLNGAYIEFLEVHDPDEAQAAGPTGAALVRLLRDTDPVLATYAIAAQLDGIDRALHEAGVPVLGPGSSSRRRPDGVTLHWRTLVPNGTTVGTALPFVIEWDGPSPASDAPPQHPNLATRITAVALTAGGAMDTPAYRALGLEVSPGTAGHAVVMIDDVAVHLGVLPDHGQRPGVEVAIDDADRFVALANRAGIATAIDGDLLTIVDPDPTVALIRYRAG